MKQKKKWLIIILIVSIVLGSMILLIIHQNKQDKRPFKKMDFIETISIQNGTKYKKIDTVIYVLAHDIFKLDTININVFYLPDVFKKSDLEYYAIVQQIPFIPSGYLILLKHDMRLPSLKLILSHEFIHIDQYENGYLSVDNKQAIWKGDTIDFKEVKYKDRPFEKEAFDKQRKIYRTLNELLYE